MSEHGTAHARALEAAKTIERSYCEGAPAVLAAELRNIAQIIVLDTKTNGRATGTVPRLCALADALDGTVHDAKAPEV